MLKEIRAPIKETNGKFKQNWAVLGKHMEKYSFVSHTKTHNGV